MNINKIINFKLPFFFSFFISALLLFSNTVLLESMLQEKNVLGASTKNKTEKTNKSGKGSVGEVFSKSDVNSHVSKVKNTALEIKKIAKSEREAGNVEVADEILDAVENISYSSIDNINPLEEVSNRPAWKNFLLGPDYKNLGEIRSNLVQTRNEIRKIEQTMEKNEGEEFNNTLRARLGELEQERLKIFNYIDQRDEGFSLFGWLAKLMSGYNNNIEEEEDLGQEVEIVDEPEAVVEDEIEDTEETEETGEPEEAEDLDEVENDEEVEEIDDTEITEETEDIEENEETEVTE